MDVYKKLSDVRAVLNRVEVRGADNLNGLLACIQALDAVLVYMQTEATKNADDHAE